MVAKQPAFGSSCNPLDHLVLREQQLLFLVSVNS
jgi:hypothetical protein